MVVVEYFNAQGFRLSGFGLVIRPGPGPGSPRTGKSGFAVTEIQSDAMRRGGERGVYLPLLV